MVDTLLAMLTRPGSPAPRVIDRHVPEHRSLIHRHREIPVGPGKKGCSLRHSCTKIPQDVPCACTVEPKPCNCGNLGHYSGRCRCTPDQIARYRSKISGPLLDRIDLQIEVPAVAQQDLTRNVGGASSDTVRMRVAAAHERQLERQGKPNSQLTTREIDLHCVPDEAGATLLKQAISRLGLSARAYHRVLKVARTIADLNGGSAIAGGQVAEAIQYRRFDRR